MLNHAKSGEAEAQYHVGLFYDSGSQGVKRDPKEALKWYTLAAEQDNANACFFLARLYDVDSSGIPNDKEKALFWYEKSSSLGNVRARNRLKNVG